MHKPDSSGVTAQNEFTNGNPGLGVARTRLEAKWMNSVLRELVSIVEGVGITLSDADDRQLIASVARHVPTIAVLRSLPVPSALVAGRSTLVFCEGNAASNDSAEGMFRWQSDSAATDDGDTVIRPVSNPTLGRWLRVSTTARHRRTTLENTLGFVPFDSRYPSGDPRRWHSISVTEDEIRGLYCHGDVPTYVDSEYFTVPGNATARYPVRTRVAVFSASTRIYGQIISVAFSTGTTTIRVRPEVGNLPASPIAVLVYTGLQLNHMNTIMVDYDAPQVLQIINKNTGASAATHVLIGDFDSSGIVIVATKSTTVGTFSGGVWLDLAPPGAGAFIHTGLAIPIVLGTHDRSRLVIPGDGLPCQFTTDLLIQHTNVGLNSSSTSRCTVDGTARGSLTLSVASVQKAEFSSSDTDAYLATLAENPLRFITNNILRLIIPKDGVSDFANEASAAAAGVPVRGLYLNGNALQMRLA